MKTFVLLLSTLIFTFPAYSKNIGLNSSNHCVLDDPVSGKSMSDLKRCIAKLEIKRNKANYPLYIYIDSPGGSVLAGLRFIDYAKTVSNLHTITSFSASMAAAITQHLPGNRYVTRSGVFMFHRAKGGVSGQFGEGELESRLRLWKKIVAESEIAQAKRIGITHRDYKKRVKDEWWLYSQEAISDNVADDVVDIRCSKKLMSQAYQKSQRSFFGTVKVTKSRCPVLN